MLNVYESLRESLLNVRKSTSFLMAVISDYFGDKLYGSCDSMSNNSRESLRVKSNKGLTYVLDI